MVQVRVAEATQASMSSALEALCGAERPQAASASAAAAMHISLMTGSRSDADDQARRVRGRVHDDALRGFSAGGYAQFRDVELAEPLKGLAVERCGIGEALHAFAERMRVGAPLGQLASARKRHVGPA